MSSSVSKIKYLLSLGVLVLLAWGSVFAQSRINQNQQRNPPIVVSGYTGLASWGATTSYCPFGAPTYCSTEASVGIPASYPFIISNLQVNVASGVLAANVTLTFTLRDASISTTLTCNLTTGASTCTDLTHNVTTVQGHLLAWQITCAGAGCAASSPGPFWISTTVK